MNVSVFVCVGLDSPAQKIGNGNLLSLLGGFVVVVFLVVGIGTPQTRKGPSIYASREACASRLTRDTGGTNAQNPPTNPTTEPVAMIAYVGVP